MSFGRIMILSAIVGAVVLGGCLNAREIPPTLRYAIDPEIAAEPATATEFTVGVRPFEVSLPYRLSMAYRDSDLRIGYREREEWAEMPGDVLTRAVIDAIAATEHFCDTGDAAEMARPDFMLTGELRRFYEDRHTTPWSAVVELRLELREARGTHAPWAETLRANVPLEGQSATALAQAMSKAVAQVAQSAAKAISGAPL